MKTEIQAVADAFKTVSEDASYHGRWIQDSIAFVDVPQVALDFAMGDSFGSVESVSKASSDVYAPVSGTIVDINEVISDEPGFVN